MDMVRRTLGSWRLTISTGCKGKRNLGAIVLPLAVRKVTLAETLGKACGSEGGDVISSECVCPKVVGIMKQGVGVSLEVIVERRQ